MKKKIAAFTICCSALLTMFAGCGSEFKKFYTLSYSAEPGGSIAGFCVQEVMAGAGGKSVRAVAAPGFTFVRWKEDGLTSAERTDGNITASASYTAEFAPVLYAVRYIAGDNGHLEVNGENVGKEYEVFRTAVNPSEMPYITAVADENYYFNMWDDELFEAERNDSARLRAGVFKANFTKNSFYTVYTATEGGAIFEGGAEKSNGAGRYETTVGYDNSITVTAKSVNPDFTFSRWSDGVTNPTRTDVVKSAFAATAIFDPLPTVITSAEEFNEIIKAPEDGGYPYAALKLKTDGYELTAANAKALNRYRVLDLSGASIAGNALSARNFFDLGAAGAKLEEIILPNTLEKIAGNAFAAYPNGYTPADSALLKRVYIPDSVTEIGDGAFRQATGLEYVRFPINDAVLKVPAECFFRAYALTAVTYNATSEKGLVIGDNIQAFGKLAFRDSGLTTAEIGENITDLGETTENTADPYTSFAFYGTIAELAIDSGNGKYKTIEVSADQRILSDFSSTTVIANISAFGEVRLPDSFTAISAGAFGRSGVTKLYAPNVTELGSAVFYDSAIEELDAPHCTDIPLNCFAVSGGGKGALKAIPNMYNITSIGKSAFARQALLTEVNFPGEEITAIPDRAFEYCTGLVSVTAAHVQKVGQYGFRGCSSLAAAELPDFTGTTGTYAFDGCSALSRFNSDKEGEIILSLSSLNDYTFSGTAFTKASVVFWDISATVNGAVYNALTAGAFRNMKLLKAVALPFGLEGVGNGAFSGCESLTEITVGGQPVVEGTVFTGAGLKYLGNAPFTGTPFISEITKVKSNSLEILGDNVFQGWTRLTDAELPAIKSLGSSFYGAENLIRFNYDEVRGASVLPSSLEKFTSGNCFRGTAVTRLIVEANTDMFPNAMFTGMERLEEIVFTRAYRFPNNSIFHQCAALGTVTFLAAPASVGGKAFDYLAGGDSVLTTINVPAGAKSVFEGYEVWPAGVTIVEMPA